MFFWIYLCKEIILMRIYCWKVIFLSFLIAVVPSLVQAKTCCCCPKKPKLWCISPPKLPSWYVDTGLGWVFSQKLGATYLANIDAPSDQYNSPKVKKMPMGSLSGGYVLSRQASWFPFTSLGLEYSYFMPAKVKGVVEEFSDPEQANFNYNYKVTHHNLRVLGKADLFRWRNWMPYLSAGLGASWNRFSNYSEEAISELPSPRENPSFANKAKLNFSYMAGAGVDYILSRNLWAGLGYRYDHFGWGKTGDRIENEDTEVVDKSLKNTSRAHTIILTLRYLFG